MSPAVNLVIASMKINCRAEAATGRQYQRPA